MSIISSRNSVGTSILKTSTPGRENSLSSIRKSKQLRFQVENLGNVRHIFKDLEENENSKGYQDLIYKLSHDELDVSFIYFMLIEFKFTGSFFLG
jgi:hypothetical protein